MKLQTSEFRYQVLLLLLVVLVCLTAGCSDRAARFTARGDEHMLLNRHAEAIEQYSRAIGIKPELAEIYYKRGMAYRSSGMIEQALVDFNRAIEINPDYALAYYARSLVYSLKDEGALAILDMNRAINLDGNVMRGIDEGMWEAYYKLGVAYKNSGGYLLAQGFLGKSLALQPSFDAYVARAEVHMLRDGYHQAAADLTRALNMSPDNAMLHSRRAAAYLEEGDLIAAGDDYNIAVILEPGNAEYRRSRGYLYLLQGKYDLALADFNSAININSNDALSYYYRGQAYLETGDYESALSDYRDVPGLSTDYSLVMQAEAGIELANQMLAGNR